MEKQDDAVAQAVYQLRQTPIVRDHLPALTDKTFPQETGSRDVLMVLFYLTCKYSGPCDEKPPLLRSKSGLLWGCGLNWGAKCTKNTIWDGQGAVT